MKYLKYLILLIIISFTGISNIYASEFIDLYSKNAILYNLNDDSILYELKSEEKVSIASLTKIMTVILAIENVEDVNEKVYLNYKCFEGLYEAGASVVGFQLGEEVTYMDLFYGALLPSGADAAQAIAIKISGSVSNFVDLMNEKAEELNLKHTHFKNVTGLDENNHYSSVKDMATLLKYALKNKTFKEIFTSKSYTATDGIKMYSTIVIYSNIYDLNISTILGGKTGYTDDAGLCLASISNLDNMNLMLVTAGAFSDNKYYQIKDAINTYEYYEENFFEDIILKKNDLLVSIKTEYDGRESINFYATEDIKKILPKDYKKNDIEFEYEGIDLLTTKSEVGSKLGTVKISYENKVIDEIDIILNDKIKFNIFRFIKVNWILSLIVFISIFILYIKVKKNKRRKRR